MQPDRTLQRGDILQISPAIDNQAFAGCLFVVDEVKHWGVTGYAQTVGPDRLTRGGLAYNRLRWEDAEPTGGRVNWVAELTVEGEATRDYAAGHNGRPQP